MNRLLLPAQLLLLAITIIFSGFLRSPYRTGGHDKHPDGTVSCFDCTNDTFYGIRANEFMMDIARYKTTHSDIIDAGVYMKGKGLEDARACWYSLDSLKKFICLIEKYASRQKVPSSQLGIRFYYAVYTPDPKQLWDPSYISRHTIFLVPTLQNNEQNIDFDPRRSTIPLGDIIRNNPGISIMGLDLTSPRRKNGMEKNQGQLCPPTCPGGSGDVSNTLTVIDKTFPNVTYTTPD